MTRSLVRGFVCASRFSAISFDTIAGVSMVSASAVNMLNASCLLGFIMYLALDTSSRYFLLVAALWNLIPLYFVISRFP